MDLPKSGDANAHLIPVINRPSWQTIRSPCHDGWGTARLDTASQTAARTRPPCWPRWGIQLGSLPSAAFASAPRQFFPNAGGLLPPCTRQSSHPFASPPGEWLLSAAPPLTARQGVRGKAQNEFSMWPSSPCRAACRRYFSASAPVSDRRNASHPALIERPRQGSRALALSRRFEHAAETAEARRLLRGQRCR